MITFIYNLPFYMLCCSLIDSVLFQLKYLWYSPFHLFAVSYKLLLDCSIVILLVDPPEVHSLLLDAVSFFLSSYCF